MIEFERFRAEDGSPIYLQMIRFIKRGIASGAVTDGDELPSRRVVSALLGVNPNTVQKAYRLLEEEGLIESHTGAKSRIVLTERTRAAVRDFLQETELRAVVSVLRQSGLGKDRALELLDRFWDEES